MKEFVVYSGNRIVQYLKNKVWWEFLIWVSLWGLFATGVVLAILINYLFILLVYLSFTLLLMFGRFLDDFKEKK